MAKARQTNKAKSPTEEASFSVGCAGVMAAGETITEIYSDAITQAYDGGGQVDEPDKLTISVVINTETLDEPGFPPIPPGRGLIGLVAGGTSGKRYEVTIPFRTDQQPRREAVFFLAIT